MALDSESVLVIGNPNAGDGSGPLTLEQYVLPLLKGANVLSSYHKTSSVQEAGELIKGHITRSTGPVVLAGGDGTVHDALNHVLLEKISGSAGETHSTLPFSLILVPTGTANALYSSFWPPVSPSAAPVPIVHRLLPADISPETAYKLQSVLAFVDKTGSSPRPLAIAHAQIFASSENGKTPSNPTSSILSCVVNSTSIHAGILHTAEKYRATIPGIERFKVAAGENIDNWGLATVDLQPPPGEQSILKYDPVAKKLAPFTEPGTISLDGPFFYFLSTINVNRLEPQFVTTPLALTSPPDGATALDVVIVRPQRKPGYAGDTADERASFVPIVMDWFGQVYNGGEHIHFKYPQNDGAEGEPVFVTEYFRVGGWKWHPKVCVV